jgi:adenylate kinase family enzyme
MLGRIVKLMKEGLLVPIEVIVELLQKTMKHGKKKARGYLIDGFRRAVDQAQGIEKKSDFSIVMEPDLGLLYTRNLKLYNMNRDFNVTP